MYGNRRQSRIPDSLLAERKFRNLDYLGWIPDSKAQNLGFRKQKFQWLRNPVYLKRGERETTKTRESMNIFWTNSDGDNAEK